MVFLILEEDDVRNINSIFQTERGVRNPLYKSQDWQKLNTNIIL